MVYDLSNEQMEEFIYLAKTRLINLGYSTYIKGQKYFYNYKDNIVKDNEELVAIRKEKSISK